MDSIWSLGVGVSRYRCRSPLNEPAALSGPYQLLSINGGPLRPAPSPRDRFGRLPKLYRAEYPLAGDLSIPLLNRIDKVSAIRVAYNLFF